jgi:hypothetical protein
VSCQKWFDNYLAELYAQGQNSVEGASVRAAGIAEGYKSNNLYVAANKRGLKGQVWQLPA